MKTKQLSEVLDSFSIELTELVARVGKSFEDKIIMGYESMKFNSHKEIIQFSIEDLNSLISDYAKLMDLGKPSIESLEEILTLTEYSVQQQGTELKLRYLTAKKVSIPNFAIKKEKLAEVYDFPSEDEELINSILEQLEELRKPDAEIRKFFNEAAGCLEFTERDEKQLLQTYTKWATLEDLTKVISLHLFCEGLSNLKASDYSFKELPEIDHRIMKMIKVDYTKHGAYEIGISVDIDKLNNPGGNPLNGITQKVAKPFFVRRK